MVGVIGDHCGSPIQLLGHHQPHQHVRQRQWSTDHFSSANADTSGECPSATDQERQVPALPAPMLQALCQLFELSWRPAHPAPPHSVLRQRSDYPPAFILRGAARIAALPRRPGSISTSSNGSQCDSRLVLGEALRDPAGARSPVAIRRAFISGPQNADGAIGAVEGMHHRVAQATSSSLDGGWSPTVHRRSRA